MNYKILPFINSVIGGLLDYLSTFYALNILNCGFYETHLAYNPLIAIGIFSLMNLIFYFVLPNTEKFNIAKIILSSFIYLGFANNIFVLLNVGFYGIII